MSIQGYIGIQTNRIVVQVIRGAAIQANCGWPAF